MQGEHFDTPQRSACFRSLELTMLLFEIARYAGTDGQRSWLEAAALLHDLGAFVEPRRHHKHRTFRPVEHARGDAADKQLVECSVTV